ncbi:putative ribonuclease H-like domain-containing protein [Tanacetum coccineum]
MVPRAVLMKSGIVSVNTTRQVNAAHSKIIVNRVNTSKDKNVNTVRPKAVVNAARPKALLNAVKGNQGNPQMDLQDQGVIDSGCSRHMTGNMSYLTNFEEIDGGYVAFGGNPKGGKITGRDESHVLLKVTRKNNMYSVDLKNVVPKGGLTCLFPKATSDESKLWHRRLRHINFKTMNKLVKGNLARDQRVKVIRTMLTNSKLPTTFWAEAVIEDIVYSDDEDVGAEADMNNLDAFMPVNPIPTARIHKDHPFSLFRVFNSRTRIVEENLHVQFSENTPNIAGSGPNWLFDIDALTNSMNYKPVVAGNQSNGSAGTKACDNAGKARMETVPGKDYILLPVWPADPLFSQSSKSSPDAGFKPSGEEEKKDAEDLGNESGNPTEGKDSEVPSTEEPRINQEKDDNINNTNNINTASDGNNTNNVNAVSSTVNAAGSEVNVVDPKTSIELPNDPNMPELEDIVYSDDDEDVGAEADMNNLDAFMPISPIPTTRIHKDHPVDQIIKDLNSTPQTRRMTKNLKEHAQEGNPSIKRSKLDRSYARGASVVQVTTEGIDYDEVFAPVAKIEAIRLFLAYASFKDFVVYQMDVKSAFLYGKIEEEVYVCQPPGFKDPDFPDRVYKVEKALYGLHQAPRAWNKTLSTYLLDNGFQRGKIDKTLFIIMDKGLQVKQKEDGIFISQDKYVTEILKKFGFSDVKTASTPMETHKPLLKDADGEDVDEHLYRSMIGSLMYLTSSRPDIMFAVCACARFQVNPKSSHLHAVKRIFRYLKGQPKLGLWYPKDSPFDLVAYTDSDYAGASLDRKSTTGGCQFLGCRLISWQCKKQTVVANSTTEAEYIAASNCCGQVLWIQNQLLDYGYNFMQTKIHIDNESTICIVKNPVFHSKTKHIEIRHPLIKRFQ